MMFSSQVLECISIKFRNKTLLILLFLLLFTTKVYVLVLLLRERNEMKGMKVRKQKVEQ